MRIIIAYASAGAGHFKAAEAIYDYFRRQHKDIDVKIVDALEKAGVLFRSSYTFGYSFLINHAVFLWRWAFLATHLRFLRRFTKPVASLVERLNTKAFGIFLEKENPDFIIATHFLPPAIAAYLKKKGKIKSRLITVITDFGIHAFWISAGTDTYVVASDYTKELLMSEGIGERNIKVLGIPVHSKFLRRYEREALCRELAIEKNKFTILILTGSFGIGPVEETVDLLYREVQILVVCAKNKGLFKRLRDKNYPNVAVFGFVENIQELMAVSDLIITKPGGLSISELLAMELVPVFISAIPGQETENIEAMKRYGIGISAGNAAEIREIVLDYFLHPDKLGLAKEKVRAIKKPFATSELYDVICQSSAGAGS